MAALPVRGASARAFAGAGHLALLPLVLLLIFTTTGCQTFYRPLPPADLSQPGWTKHQGQAVWTLPGSTHDVAGEVLVAVTPDKRSFVQFSKSPFNLVIGQTTQNRWQVEFPPQNKHYSGPGAPPKRLLWLYVARALQNQPLPPHCTWTNLNGNWSLENHRSGEKVEGFFAQ